VIRESGLTIIELELEPELRHQPPIRTDFRMIHFACSWS